MSNKECNGWVNQPTWNINLMFQETFISIVEEQSFDDIQHVADSFESVVNELEYENLKDGSFAQQCVGDYLSKVDWREIAEHYVCEEDFLDEELDLFEEEN